MGIFDEINRIKKINKFHAIMEEVDDLEIPIQARFFREMEECKERVAELKRDNCPSKSLVEGAKNSLVAATNTFLTFNGLRAKFYNDAKKKVRDCKKVGRNDKSHRCASRRF